MGSNDDSGIFQTFFEACGVTQSADRTVSSFVDPSAQHSGNEAEPKPSPNVPCQSAQTDKSVSSA